MSSTTLARSLVRQMLEAGMTEFVLSPGSRNAPISVALYEAKKRGLIELYTRIDERGAAYFALGLAKSSSHYVGVVCTSGTAVANFHPAALEAHHSQEKLLFITADRPARLRKTGANQTTLQVDALAPIECIDCDRAIELAERLSGSPIQLNVQFEEPLIESDSVDWLAGMKVNEIAARVDREEQLTLTEGSVLVIGHDRGGFDVASIQNFIDAAGIPVIAEDPLSFPTAFPHAALVMSDKRVREFLHAQQVIVIGRTTLSRSINAYIAEADTRVVIDPRVTHVDTERKADQIFTSLPTLQHLTSSDWLKIWQSSHIQVKAHSWSEQEVASTISRSLPEESAFFVASSRPIRDIEAFASPRAGLTTYANRGLAGIDGNLSTALGIATHHNQTFAILGDLSFIHDLSALANLPKVNLTVFLVDNNGGGIFSTLPGHHTEGFEEILGTPHNLNLENVVKGFGVEVVRVKSSSDIEYQISKNVGGVRVILVEVPPRETNSQGLEEMTQRAVNAFLIGANLA